MDWGNCLAISWWYQMLPPFLWVTQMSVQDAAVGCFVAVVLQALSSGWLFVTPWTAAHQASLSFTISRSLLKLMSTELVIPANHLILCHSLPLLPSVFPSMRVFSSELVLCIRWPKCWCFSFSISPSSEYSGLIYFRVVWLDLLAVSKGLSRVLPNTTVQKHQFFNTQLYLWSSFHIHT